MQKELIHELRSVGEPGSIKDICREAADEIVKLQDLLQDANKQVEYVTKELAKSGKEIQQWRDKVKRVQGIVNY